MNGRQVQLCAPFYALEDAAAVLRGWREFTAAAPGEVSALAIFWSVPDVETFPAEARRKPVAILPPVYAGPPEEDSV